MVSFSPNRGEGPKVYQGKQVQSPCENCRELERQVYLAESRSLGFAMQNMNLRRELANYLLTSTPLKSDQPVSSLMSKGEGEGTNTDIALSNIPYSHTGVPNQATVTKSLYIYIYIQLIYRNTRWEEQEKKEGKCDSE